MSQQTPASQQQASPDDDHDLVVEAALFSAGRPLPVEELTEQTGLTQHQVKDALIALREVYKGRRTALDIVKSGQKWAMALRAEYAEQTRHIVPPEVPRHVVRTLALIAYHQPILQSDLKDLVGSKVYEHVGHLVDAGMIRKRPDGLTYSLSTTSDFPEYFGIPEDDPERIRNFLAEKVGIEPETGEAAVEQYEPDQAAAGDDPDQGETTADPDAETGTDETSTDETSTDEAETTDEAEETDGTDVSDGPDGDQAPEPLEVEDEADEEALAPPVPAAPEA